MKNKSYNYIDIYQSFQEYRRDGYTYTGSGYSNTKLIEMDYFDILYDHGIVGFVLLFSI